MHYLDNAATTYPKPEEVYRQAELAMRQCGGNPGRGIHPQALASVRAVFDTREKIADMFGGTPERVVFVPNATYALNLSIKGLFVWNEGHILISDMEHNSVRRPVEALCRESGGKIRYDTFSVRGRSEDVLAGIRSKLRPDTRMAVVCHRSNVAPITLPIKEIGRLCHDRGIRFVVDASQSAGSLRSSLPSCNIDALCAPGHKGLFGLMGSGFALFSDKVDQSEIRTVVEGGSGLSSVDPGMPTVLPERLEAGTVAVPAISSLSAGIDYVNRVGLDRIAAYESGLLLRAQEMLLSMRDVTVYGPIGNAGSAFMFNVGSKPPSEVAAALGEKGICVRAGLHCSPLAHKLLATPKGGAVRVSFSPLNDLSDCEALYKAVREVK